MNEQIESMLLVTISALFISVCIIIEKNHLLNYFSPMDIVIVRRSLFIFILFIMLFYSPKLYDKIKNINSSIVMYLALTLLLGGLGIVLFFYLLKKNKTSLSVSMWNPLIIVFSILFSCVFYKEKINTIEFAGILFALVGILILVFNKTIEFHIKKYV